MTNNPARTSTPAPHGGEKEAPAIPEFGQTPGMGAPPQDADNSEPETRDDGDAMAPDDLDPHADRTEGDR